MHFIHHVTSLVDAWHLAPAAFLKGFRCFKFPDASATDAPERECQCLDFRRMKHVTPFIAFTIIDFIAKHVSK
jgi:hypothetical protein